MMIQAINKIMQKPFAFQEVTSEKYPLELRKAIVKDRIENGYSYGRLEIAYPGLSASTAHKFVQEYKAGKYENNISYLL